MFYVTQDWPAFISVIVAAFVIGVKVLCAVTHHQTPHVAPEAQIKVLRLLRGHQPLLQRFGWLNTAPFSPSVTVQYPYSNPKTLNFTPDAPRSPCSSFLIFIVLGFCFVFLVVKECKRRLTRRARRTARHYAKKELRRVVCRSLKTALNAFGQELMRCVAVGLGEAVVGEVVNVVVCQIRVSSY